MSKRKNSGISYSKIPIFKISWWCCLHLDFEILSYRHARSELRSSTITHLHSTMPAAHWLAIRRRGGNTASASCLAMHKCNLGFMFYFKTCLLFHRILKQTNSTVNRIYMQTINFIFCIRQTMGKYVSF